ncbi:hypothetical protein H0H81_003025 [Sphagnurus paluster]|uniref:Uncharacterized protein n=1 Tax=Sphagnurus paluster TaxID=117069 RepID=A0A9P7FSS4_9AGAR|nr:hypothetical protein H0H81_003025 [Sphagnurus paluster]
MVVGALIFVLGIDLVKEALWDTRHRTSRTEYVTIVSIVIVMTVWDFVAGVLFGIIASCALSPACVHFCDPNDGHTRLLLRGAEFAEAQYPRAPLGRDRDVDSAQASPAACLLA